MSILYRDRAGNRLVVGNKFIGVKNRQGRYVTKPEFNKFLRKVPRHIFKRRKR